MCVPRNETGLFARSKIVKISNKELYRLYEIEKEFNLMKQERSDQTQADAMDNEILFDGVKLEDGDLFDILKCLQKHEPEIWLRLARQIKTSLAKKHPEFRAPGEKSNDV